MRSSLIVQFRTEAIAQKAFLNHIDSNSKVKKYFILIALLSNTIPAICKLPIVGQVSNLALSLWNGYLTETKFQVASEPIPPQIQNEFSDQTEIIEKLFLERTIFDFIVIGSGPGAVAAVSNISAGSSILVLEKGIEPRTTQDQHHTLSHVRNDFDKSGQELILSIPPAQFAQGSVLGGGSEVNSGLYHKLPEVKKAAYLDHLNLRDDQWVSAEEWVENLLNIQTVGLDPNQSLIARGAQNLNLNFGNIPRWRKYQKGEEFIHFGMREVFWNSFRDLDQERYLLTNSKVVNINSKSSFVEVLCENNLGEKSIYRAKEIILSAGAIQSARLLAESKLIDWRQTRFQWHPMYRAIVSTKVDDLGFGDIDPFQAWTNDFALKFGSAVSTPGLLGIGLNQVISQSEYPTLRSFYVSHVSQGVGGIFPHTSTPWYKMNSKDIELREKGRALLREIILNGGGKFHKAAPDVKRNSSTVHIFGTLPIDSEIYLKGSNRLRANPRIHICDSSILPFGPGVNPQGVIMTAVKGKTMGLGE